MKEQIQLSAYVEYNTKYPPSNAKKAYIAKITGRTPGPMKYNREFLGQDVTLLPGDEGLYELQFGDKKGGATRYYYAILSHPEHGLIKSADCESEVPAIAKLLDQGLSIDAAVEVENLRPSTKTEGLMLFDAKHRTAGQAKQAVRSATIESAVEHCLQVLRLMPPAEQKKVLAGIKAALQPAPEPQPQVEPVTETEAEPQS